MSGGAYDYKYSKVRDLAGEIAGGTVLRRAFKAHLLKVSEALYKIEWVDSGDSAPGDEDEAVRACLPAEAELRQAIDEAKAAMEELHRTLTAAGCHTIYPDKCDKTPQKKERRSK